MKHPRPRLFSLLTRGFLVTALVLGGLSPAAWASEIDWLRILVDQADPLTWRSGESMPSRPKGFPLEPSAVFSYTTLAPGQELDDSELARRARGFERALLECGRFSRAAVYIVEAGPEGAGGGLRLLLGPPVNIWIDLGYAAGLCGSGEFLFSVASKPLF